MDKQYTLRVDKQDIVVLQQAVEKIQITGKDSIIVANVYSKILDVVQKILKDTDSLEAPNE